MQNIILEFDGGNGSGIAEGRDLEVKSFNLAQILNRTTKD
jgi:hypothetical protein